MNGKGQLRGERWENGDWVGRACSRCKVDIATSTDGLCLPCYEGRCIECAKDIATTLSKKCEGCASKAHVA